LDSDSVELIFRATSLGAVSQRYEIKSSSTVSIPKQAGGINLNPALINLQIKRDPNGVALPAFQQPIHNIKIRGFLPVIIRVTPVDLRELLEFDNVSRYESQPAG